MIEALLALVEFGSFGFWLVSAILSVAVIFCLEMEFFGWVTMLVVGAFALFGKSIFGALSFKELCVGTVLYFIIGGIWSVTKWYFYVKHEISSSGSKPDKGHLEYTLSPSNNKGRIYGWIAYWPWSIVWTVAHDTVIAIFDSLKSVYEKITSNALSKI